MDVAYSPLPHTFENIAKTYNHILRQYGMNPEDLFKTVSDNALNMKQAFKVSLWDDDDSINPVDRILN